MVEPSNGREWCCSAARDSYEEAQSIAAKGAYTRRNGLGGAIIWNIGEGYVPEQVGQENALLEAVNAAFLPTH
jgi:chitinase